ncbi:MAG: methyl-accepting chemotaxis protein [Desulfuromonadales bacterium]
MKSSNIKIGVRLGLAFAVIVFLMMIVGGYAISRMTAMNEKVDSLTDDKWPKTVMLNDTKGQLNIIARALRNAVIISDTEETSKEIKRVIEAREVINKRLEELNKVVRSDTGKALLKEIVDARFKYLESQKTVIVLIEGGDKEKAGKELMTSVRKTQSAYFEKLDKMIEYQSKEMDKTGKDVESIITQSRIVVISILLAALILSIVLAVIIVRSITKPVSELVIMNERLANGDLTISISVTGADEVGQLADSSRRVVENLKEILNKVSDTSSQVASASNQLQSTAEQIATGAEEVAAQTSTVATASEEMAATSSDIARNCSMAADSSRQTSESATRGSAVVQETITGMGRIAERVKLSAATVENLGKRSEQIGEIVGTIEDIADQTNLLALNAAIEAARAGEQGRGFAVVADEVRALAERTTKATKEISEMIKAIQNETKAAVRAMEEGVSEVEKGAASSEKSGQALEEILSQINEVTMQVNQIATAAEEQTATTSEITSNIQQVTEVVEQTSRGASETATAASQLSSNALILQDLVRRFKLA